MFILISNLINETKKDYCQQMCLCHHIVLYCIVCIKRQREVSTAEGMKLARDLNSLFIETSALESLMVKEAFDLLIDSWLGSLWVKGVEQPRYLPSKEAARKLVMRKAGTSDDTQDKHKNCVVQ